MKDGETFFTAINCMDGRVQEPALKYLKRRFQVTYVDVVTEPGPCGILSARVRGDVMESIFRRVDISVQAHHSTGIALLGHHDCAGNPFPKEIQVAQVRDAVKFLKSRYPDREVVGLWVGETWEVEELG